MKITTDAKNLDVQFLSMSREDVLPPKKDQEGNQKTDDKGNPLFAARGLKAVRMFDGVPTGSDDSVTVAVRNQPQGGLSFGQVYRLAGAVTVTHYVAGNGRLGVSITADGIASTARQGSGE